MDIIYKQIPSLFNGDATSLIVTLLLLISIWLYKELKKTQDTELTAYKENLKKSEAACADILKNLELASAKKISDSEFYASIYQNLSSLDIETSEAILAKLSANSRSINDFKSIVLYNLKRLKKEHSPSRPKKSGDSFYIFLYNLGTICKPAFQTIVIIYFILNAVVYMTDLKNSIIFLVTVFLFSILGALIIKVFDRTISINIFFLCLLIGVLPIIVAALFHNLISFVTLAIIVTVAIAIISNKYHIDSQP
ncbi:hypothetical protein P8876_04840 [Bacillus haynesii]|nr:hypothetical protein [Bacillus haynesii]